MVVIDKRKLVFIGILDERSMCDSLGWSEITLWNTSMRGGTVRKMLSMKQNNWVWEVHARENICFDYAGKKPSSKKPSTSRTWSSSSFLSFPEAAVFTSLSFHYKIFGAQPKPWIHVIPNPLFLSQTIRNLNYFLV